MEEKETPQKRNLTVETAFSGKGPDEPLPPVRVYLFDHTGNYVSSEPAGQTNVTFQIDDDTNYRIVVGPDLLTNNATAVPGLSGQLARARAVTYDVIPQAKQDVLRAALSKFIWYCWWKTCVVVHGNVRKLINPGSPNPQYLPICSGVVQIFQVDLDCTLDQLVSFHVLTLRDALVSRLHGLEVDPAKLAILHGPIPPGPLREARNIGVAAQSTVSSHATVSSHSTVAAQSTLAQPRATTSLSEAATSLAALDGIALKQYIVANKAILWLFLCELIPDWAFCWQELGETPLQSDGSFSAEICFWCPEDFPDLYFEVVQNINGVSTEIYDPQIACNTYYNYDGSSSVEIVVTDQRAAACLPTGGGPDYLYVEVLGITDIDLQSIDGLNTPFTSGTGLVTWGGNPLPVPFGGELAFNMKFHPNMYGYYYRWSYMFDGETGFTPITASVTHQYQQLVSLSPLMFLKLPVVLGPHTVGGQHNLFAFPDPSLNWVSVDNYQDLFFGFFDSTGGITDPVGYIPSDNDGVSARKSGMCTLLLEIFDSSGNFVACNNPFGSRTEGDTGGPSAPGPFSFLLPQGSAYVTAPTGNITDQGRLLFRIRVDNNQTVAKLPGVHAGVGSADPCGFLHFSDLTQNIAIDYVARHHNNFLDWRLDVSRGLCGIAAQLPGTGNSPSSPYPAVADFNNTAGALLGVTPPATCGNCPNGAAFAVNLYCWAQATNGRSRMQPYDSQATIAFALLNP